MLWTYIIVYDNVYYHIYQKTARYTLLIIMCIKTAHALLLYMLIINPHNIMWGQFDPRGSFPCTVQKPPASQF